MVSTVVCSAGENMNSNNDDARKWSESALAGQPVDIAPWTYEWRADRAVQPNPEAYFIPRRLDRIDKVYRTAYDALPPDQLRSIYYDLTDMLKPLLPAPKGKLQAGLLWIGGLNDYRVELRWPSNVKTIPSPESVEVRAYPTSFGWFGWTVDKILSNPVISGDGRTWTYKSDPAAKMDWGYSEHVPAATEMVAVFCEGEKPAVPNIHITGPNVGSWKQIAVEIEWGFQPGTEDRNFDARIEPYVAKIGPIAPLSDDNGVIITGDLKWESQAANESRRGVVIPLLYAPDSRPGLDSRITVWGKKTGFTFRISDLDKGPIYIPEHGVFITKAGSGQTARQFVKELSARNLKNYRQMTQEHPEVSSWDELMQNARLWSCPEGTTVPPFAKTADPVIQVQVPDQRWEDAWRVAVDQLRGTNMWGNLAHEIGRVVRINEMMGLSSYSDPIYDYFLKSPGVKSDGDFVDAKGSLEWAKDMRHDMGYSHEGTHASTGRVLFAMCDRYFYSGDKSGFMQHKARLQEAADWIIRQRTQYMKDIPNRDKLFVAGLMPPHQMNDYAMPASDWRWYYSDNALALQGLQRFADVMMAVDPKAGKKYENEAKAYRDVLLHAMEKDASLAPVRLGRDGMYHTFVPRMAYARGLTGLDLHAPQFPNCDLFWGSLPATEKFAAMDANDYRVRDTIDIMEEMGLTSKGANEQVELRKSKGLPADDAWFWTSYAILPKLSHNANVYLLQDDVPNFLRWWMNTYAGMVGSNGKLWEHWHLGQYSECDAPDTMTAGWFLENYRNMLLMEDDQSLWIARATPRVWLEQGKRIAVKGAPTYFGDLAYEIISDVENGHITATIQIPNRAPIKTVIVRFRHPQSTPIQSVTVNGKSWKGFNPAKETIELKGFTGKTVVVAYYKEAK